MPDEPDRECSLERQASVDALGAFPITRRGLITQAGVLSGAAALSGLGASGALAQQAAAETTSATPPMPPIPKVAPPRNGPVQEPDVIPNIRVAITDSYGTVFDIKTALVTALRPHVQQPEDFATMWLSQVLAWTETVAAMGPHAYFEFWELVGRAGRWVAQERKVELTEAAWQEIMQAWWTPQPFEDAEVFFNTLHGAGIPTAILSNGSPNMLHAAADAAGWLAELETIISVDQAHTYKSSPQAYLLAHDVFKVPAASDILFISGHQWDVAGAGAAGLRTVFVNRDNQPMWFLKDDYVDYVFNDMGKLAQAILRGRDVTGPDVVQP